MVLLEFVLQTLHQDRNAAAIDLQETHVEMLFQFAILMGIAGTHLQVMHHLIHGLN